jgi:hypothetical protein
VPDRTIGGSREGFQRAMDQVKSNFKTI